MFDALSRLQGPGGKLSTAPVQVDLFLRHEDFLSGLADQYMREQTDVACNSSIVYTAGPPGAGKSRLLDDLRRGNMFVEFRHIDPDAIKDLILSELELHGVIDYRHRFILPDKDVVYPRELAKHVHRASTDVADQVRWKAMANGENIIMDGTFAWELIARQYIAELVKYEYESVQILVVKPHLAQAIEGVKQRWWRGRQERSVLGGRFVPVESIEDCFAGGLDLCHQHASELADLVHNQLEVSVGELVSVSPRWDDPGPLEGAGKALPGL